MGVPETIVFFDLETTGVDIDKDEIIQIGAVAVSPPPNLNPLMKFEVKIKPTPEGAAKTKSFKDTVYDSEVWEREGVRPSVGFGRFSHFLKRYAKVPKASKRGKRYYVARLAGYNCAKFDYPFLRKEFNRYDFFLPADWYTWDIMHWAMGCNAVLGLGLTSFTLSNVAEALGVSLDNAHEAIADVKATLGIADELLKRLGDGLVK